MPVKTTIRGADKLMRTLATLSKTGGKRAMRKATAAGGTVLKQAVKDGTPVDEGKLKRAQDSKVTSRGYHMSAIVGANVAKLIADSDASGGQRPTNIDHLVEFGHTAPDGQVIPPKGYMRRAADSAMPAAERRYVDKLAEEITREALR